MNFMTSHIYIYILIGNVIIPTDYIIFFRGVGIPPTRYDMTRSMYQFFSFTRVPRFGVIAKGHTYSETMGRHGVVSDQSQPWYPLISFFATSTGAS